MYGCLDHTNIYDIENRKGARRQKAKLLKILMMKGTKSCKELFRVVVEDLKREELIKTMEKKSSNIEKRGNHCFRYLGHLVCQFKLYM